MRLYISGAMSLGGTVDHTPNMAPFHAAAQHLRELGHDVINPAESIGDQNTRWADWLRCDIRNLLTCDAIVMLPRWEESKGARLENHIARELGMHVHNTGDFE